jgi:hypothetical protein
MHRAELTACVQEIRRSPASLGECMDLLVMLLRLRRASTYHRAMHASLQHRGDVERHFHGQEGYIMFPNKIFAHKRRSMERDPHLHCFCSRPRPWQKSVRCSPKASAEGRHSPRPRRAHKPNIGAHLNNALQQHRFPTFSHIQPTPPNTTSQHTSSRIPQTWLVNSSSEVTSRCALQPSREHRMGALRELTTLQEWYYQVHQRHLGELEQRKARPQDW